jgi:tetratricopeptide (TPR) repeat protein
MAQGQYEMALSEAKSLYNVSALAKTSDAVKLMASVLAKARGYAIADQFRREQSSNKLSHLGLGATGPGGGILRTIAVDSSIYEKAIQQRQDKTDNLDSVIGCGNLLLLADRPRDAQECFEFALQLAARGKDGKLAKMRIAIEGIARAIRDEDGSALRADAFVMSMKGKGSTSLFPVVSSKFPDALDPALMGHAPVLPNMPDSSISARAHAAAAAVVPSGIFNGDLELRNCESPEDPSVKASGDARLSAWLGEWQSTTFRSDNLKERRSELQQLLKDTPLSCLTLVGIARAISLQSNDDWTAAAFYAAAAWRGDKELRSYPAGSREARPILVALNSAKPTLWTVVDGGDRNFVDALYVLNSDLVQWISDNESSLRDAKAHGLVGAAECLWVWGKYDEALLAAQSIDTASMNDSEKRAVAWILGLALYSTDHFSDAATQFRVVASDQEFKYAESASSLLAVSLARSQRPQEANLAFDQWVRLYHPKIENAARVLDLMGMANAIGQAGKT